MSRRWLWATVMLTLSAGCVESCGCGEPGQPGQPGQGAEPGTSEGTATQPLPSVGSGSPGDPDQRDAGVARPMVPAPAWEPAPDSKLTRELAALQAQILAAVEAAEPVETLASAEALGAPLTDKLAGLPSVIETVTQERSSAEAGVISSVRTYQLGDTRVRVKITDTGRAHAARRAAADRLTSIGNASAGFERGSIVRGYPAVHAQFDDRKSSRATMLLGQRYLVQVMIQNPSEPDHALKILQALDWKGLAPSTGKLPKLPKAASTSPQGT